jgi:hypothetical protein
MVFYFRTCKGIHSSQSGVKLGVFYVRSVSIMAWLGAKASHTLKIYYQEGKPCFSNGPCACRHLGYYAYIILIFPLIHDYLYFFFACAKNALANRKK